MNFPKYFKLNQNALNKNKAPKKALEDAQAKIDETIENYGGKFTEIIRPDFIRPDNYNNSLKRE